MNEWMNEANGENKDISRQSELLEPHKFSWGYNQNKFVVLLIDKWVVADIF